jgi:hypothetical protein
MPASGPDRDQQQNHTLRTFDRIWKYPRQVSARKEDIPLWLEFTAFPYKNYFSVRAARQSDQAYNNDNFLDRFYLPITGTMKTEDVAQYSPGNTPARGVVSKILEGLDNPARFWAEGWFGGSEILKLYSDEASGDAQRRGVLNMDPKENLFGGMTFRSYGFNWDFLPWDSSGSNYLANLCYAFSTLAYPGYIGLASKMKHPPVWTIKTYDSIPAASSSYRRTDWDFNPKLCVLQGARTNRTKSGRPYTIGNTHDPASISLSATFVEIEPLVRFMDGELYTRSEIKAVDPTSITQDQKDTLLNYN